jgi:hypothetical protein
LLTRLQRLAVLREVYKAKGIVLVRFNMWTGDEEGCKKQFNEEHVFVNNVCSTLLPHWLLLIALAGVLVIVAGI